jgi:pimeloyl-ACP methyl ester carboxylesterase
MAQRWQDEQVEELAQQVSLPDGRRLGYARFGDPGGEPLIYLHGFPASRLEAGLLHPVALELGISIIAPDRPGFGLSDFQPGRTLLDWPGDVENLAGSLGLDAFCVLGGSGGCPYAAACAYRLPQRVTRAGSLAGLGPTTDPMLTRPMDRIARCAFLLARRAPRLYALAYGGLGEVLARRPDLLFQLNKPSPPDREVLSRPEVITTLTRSTGESFRQGTRAAVHELRLLAHPWGFRLEDVGLPFFLTHGLEDDTVPAAMSEYLAAKLPDAHLRLIPGEGHVSLPVRHGADILKTLVFARDWPA